MDYTGYTSFIAGDDILELIRDWYDIRTEEIYEYDDEENAYQIFYHDSDNDEYVEVGYDDFLKNKHDSSLDAYQLYANYGDENNADYQPVYLLDDEGEMTSIVKTYGDLTIVDDDSELDEVDLSYFFKDTLSSAEDSDYLFYAEDYYTGEDDNISVGGAFYCQYPDDKTIERCSIMKDFGENNSRILELWEDFKSGELPTTAIVILSIEVG